MINSLSNECKMIKQQIKAITKTRVLTKLRVHQYITKIGNGE